MVLDTEMFGVLSYEVLIVIFIILLFFPVRVKSSQIKYPMVILASVLIFIATFRDGEINPDYYAYVQNILHANTSRSNVEVSFVGISQLSLFLGGGPYWVFFIYAIIGISLKSYAVYKFSPQILYSILVWITFSYLLHDLIQIRAAISAGFLLLMIPYVYDKKYFAAIIVWILAIFFHYSALIFGFLFIIRKSEIRPILWVMIYLIVFILNTIKYPIFSFIVKTISYLPSFLTSRFFILDAGILDNISRMNMYSRYILIPTLFLFISLIFHKRIQEKYKYSIVCIKTCFIGIYCFGIGFPVISGRLYELLSVPYIYLVPTCIYWFKDHPKIKSKITAITFCLFVSWNLIYKQEVFELPESQKIENSDIN